MSAAVRAHVACSSGPGLRPATLADLGWLVAVERDLFGAGAWSKTSLRDEIEAADRVVLAIGAASIVGYAVLAAAGETADLRRIGVARPAQRGGVGTLLFDDALSRARARGCAELLLEVAAGNEPAVGLYEQAGMVAFGRRPRYYADGSDALVYRLALR
jgi:ribosomal-protein-alanine N-acetyltransferase